MRINTPGYKFYRTLDGYYIECIGSGTVTYYVYQIENNYKTLVLQNEYLQEGDPELLEFPEEGSYIISIRYSSESTSFQPGTYYNYYVRYYPTLRARLIPTIRNLICQCSQTSQDLCTNGQYNKSQQIRNDIYLAINSLVAYKDILQSPCFVKYTEHAFRLLIGEGIDRYVQKLEYYMDYVDTYGYSPDTEQLLRETMSYFYIMAYFTEKSEIDFDYVEAPATAGSSDYNDGEQDALDELFAFSELENCYAILGINVNMWIAKFESIFTSQIYTCENGLSYFYQDATSKFEEFVELEGKQTFNALAFEIDSNSIIFINGVAIPSSDYIVSGTTVTLSYGLSVGDRITIIK
jgi:hypothetical protein